MPEDIVTPEPTVESPPWGDDFDAEKAWKKIQNITAENKTLKARPVLTDDAKAKLDQFEQIEQASKSEIEKVKESLGRYQSEMESWRSAAVAAKVQAFAASDFADPDDAVRSLDSTSYLDAGGVIDEARIKADLTDLLTQKPHYRKPDATPPGPRTPAPNGAQGSSGRPVPANPNDSFAAALHTALGR